MKKILLFAAIAAVVVNLSYAHAEESFDVAKATSIIEQRSEEFDQALIAKDAAVEFYNVDSGEITGTGQALLVWMNDGGQWRIFRDVYKPNPD